MIRFWEKETREARKLRVKRSGLFTLPSLPAPDWKGIGRPSGDPNPLWVGWGRAGAAPQHQGGVRSCKCCRVFLLSWAALPEAWMPNWARRSTQMVQMFYMNMIVEWRAFTEAELGWKTFLWLSTSHMWEQKHTKVEIKTWQKKKKQKTKQKTLTQTNVFEISGRKIIIIIKKKGYFSDFW